MATDAQVTLLYGETDTGKTTALADIAMWLNKTYGFCGRLITADSNYDAFADILQTSDNPNGYVQVVRLDKTEKPWAALNAMTKLGLWPQQTLKGVQFTQARPDNLGFYMVEGLTMISNLLLGNHALSGRKMTEEVSAKWSESVIGEGGKEVMFNAANPGRSHYMSVQRFMIDQFIPGLRSLPVPIVCITAHEAKGTDAIWDNKQALGPATVGKATVDQIVQLFPETFHVQVTMTKTGPERYAYFVSHPDPVVPMMNWPAKVGMHKSHTAEALKKWPGGKIPLTLTAGMEQWLEWKKSRGLLRVGTQTPDAPATALK